MLIKDFTIINPRDLPIKWDFINYIDTSAVLDGKLLGIQELFSNYPSRAQRVVKGEDILISSVRPNLLHNYFVKKHILHGVASTGFVQIRVKNKNIALPRFLYYYLTSHKLIAYYTSIAETSQSTFPAFNKDIIETAVFPAISLEKQQHIVNTLLLIVSIENRCNFFIKLFASCK